MRAEVSDSHPNLFSAIDALISAGGKRLRPTVLLLVGRMIGAEIEALTIMAAAVELLHNATLIHDDLLDGALFRRGVSTLNAQWPTATTVLMGDYAFSRAAKLASQTGSARAMRKFAETLSIIVNGEITQMFSDARSISRENYFQRIYAKTASLFEAASGVAAILSNANEEIIESAIGFGRNLGMAFQIVDDVLDFTGEQATVGKPVASDLRHGTVTLPAIYYLEANPDCPDMKAFLNGGRADEKQIARLVDVIRTSGSVRQSLDEARRFVDRSFEFLEAFPDGIERQALRELGQYIVDRDV